MGRTTGQRKEETKRRHRRAKTKLFGHHRYRLWDDAKTKQDAEDKAWQVRRLGVYVHIYKVQGRKARGSENNPYLIYIASRRRKRRGQ